jgi:hypothetical protein
VTNLFGIDMAAEIAAGFEGQLVIGKLERTEPGTRTSGELTGGTNPSTSSHSFNGFREDFNLRHIDGTNVRATDWIAFLLGATLPAGVFPQPGDRITIDGSIGNVVRLLERDPAGATYRCQMR